MQAAHRSPGVEGVSKATAWLLELEGSEVLPVGKHLGYLADDDINPDHVVTLIGVHNPALVRARMTDLERSGWTAGPSTRDETRGVDPSYLVLWNQVQQCERLLVLLESHPDEPEKLVNFAVRGPGQWLIEELWRLTGVVPVNPGTPSDSEFFAAWSATHPIRLTREPDAAFDFVPIGAGIARAATWVEAFRALSLWPLPTSFRRGVLPTLLVGTAGLSSAVLWLLGYRPLWLVAIASLVGIIGLHTAVTALAARRLTSAPQPNLLISETNDAVIGLQIQRGSRPHVLVHTHYASPVGSGAGRRLRANLAVHVKVFLTEIEPGMSLTFTCSDALWRRLASEVDGLFPKDEGWRVARVHTTTTIANLHSS